MIEVGNVKYLFSDRAKTIQKVKALKMTETPDGKVHSFTVYCPISNEFIVSFDVTEVTGPKPKTRRTSKK